MKYIFLFVFGIFVFSCGAKKQEQTPEKTPSDSLKTDTVVLERTSVTIEVLD